MVRQVIAFVGSPIRGKAHSGIPSYVRAEMPETPEPHQTTPVSCQAIPGAARRGWRTDVLCASAANTEVQFHGRAIPVCRIHSRTYERWGAQAEARAGELWGWQTGLPQAS
jgi:hypothetical protein